MKEKELLFKDLIKIKPITKLSEVYELIELINENYPKLKDLCFYDKEFKCLNSRDSEKATFYYDPFHSVLEIKAFK